MTDRIPPIGQTVWRIHADGTETSDAVLQCRIGDEQSVLVWSSGGGRNHVERDGFGFIRAVGKGFVRFNYEPWRPRVLAAVDITDALL